MPTPTPRETRAIHGEERPWTYGEWSAEKDEFGDWSILATVLFDDFSDEGDQTIVVEGVQGWPETEANARLIAAAPDLYEQVELFVRCIEYQIRVAESKGDDEGARLQSMTLALARAALSRARGEPQ